MLPWDLALESISDDVAITCDFDQLTGTLSTSVTNTSPAPIRPVDFALVADVDLSAGDGWAWLHGRYMQKDALVRRFAAPPDEGYEGDHVDRDDDSVTYVSEEVLLLTLPSQATPSIALGSLRGDRFACQFRVQLVPEEDLVERIAIIWDVEGIELQPGETVQMPPLWIQEGATAGTLIARYADAAGLEMGARVPIAGPSDRPVGWCSWDYFGSAVTEADVNRNVVALQPLAAQDPSLRTAVVQIDDGFQPAIGDWLAPKASFPSGMETMANQIAASGFRPGVWLAPLLLGEGSAVLREHPEFALKSTDGSTLLVDTWLGRCAVLDCTAPAAAEWLSNLVQRVVRDWGYTYLKLDALAYAVQPAHDVCYAEAGTTGLANLRRGLEIIREAAGEDCFLLGCTCHFSAALGIVDGMRVGPDVKGIWEDGPNPSVRHAMRMTLQRNWMHGRWWLNDPDCLLVREQNSDLSEPEVRFLATGVAMSGGSVLLGDDLPRLSPDRLALGLSVIPGPGIAAAPAIAGEAPVPSTWRTTLPEGRSIVGILNWEESARWVVATEVLRPGEVGFDMFSGKIVGRGDQLLRPHEGTLWQVSGPGPTPRVIGDTGSLTYHQLYQRQVSGRIQVRNDSARSRLLAVEVRGQTRLIDLAPGEMRWFD